MKLPPVLPQKYAAEKAQKTPKSKAPYHTVRCRIMLRMPIGQCGGDDAVFFLRHIM